MRRLIRHSLVAPVGIVFVLHMLIGAACACPASMPCCTACGTVHPDSPGCCPHKTSDGDRGSCPESSCPASAGASEKALVSDAVKVAAADQSPGAVAPAVLLPDPAAIAIGPYSAAETPVVTFYADGSVSTRGPPLS